MSGTKQCSTCDVVKYLSAFYLRADTSKHRAQCNECFNKVRRSIYHNNVEHYRRKRREYAATDREKGQAKDRYLKRTYGLTLSEYKEQCATQDNRCEICDIQCSLVVDHDHDTGEVRGLLCNNCNTGIGLLKDEPEVLKKAIEYIRRGQ